MGSTLRLLFFGDIMGASGREAVTRTIGDLKTEFKPDIIIANIENATHGFGLTSKHFDELAALDIHVMTSGNHIWDQKESEHLLRKHAGRLLRPGNYPSFPDDPCPGTGIGFVPLENGSAPLCVINLQGRVFMDPIDCPFQFLESVLPEIQQQTNLIFVDFHAQATSEKLALAHYFDGQLSAIVGTHTHVQTSDAQVFPNGTAYVTDVGVCGSHFSVIGMKPAGSIYRLRYKRPARLAVADERIRADVAILELNCKTGRASSIQAKSISI